MEFPIGIGQNKFAKGVKPTFIGALIHGVGLRFYRTTDCVKKSANLIVHILLTEIEEYQRRNFGNLPYLIYVNVSYTPKTHSIVYHLTTHCIAPTM